MKVDDWLENTSSNEGDVIRRFRVLEKLLNGIERLQRRQIVGNVHDAKVGVHFRHVTSEKRLYLALLKMCHERVWLPLAAVGSPRGPRVRP